MVGRSLTKAEVRGLPAQLQPNLDLPRRRLRRINEPRPWHDRSIRIEQCFVVKRRREIGVIKKVENIEAKLHIEVIRNAINDRVFVQRHVKIPKPRTG